MNIYNKLYLDDMRKAPKGWKRVYRAKDMIELLKKNKTSEISLDHDLGTEDTGYDVLLWIEEQVATQGFKPPKINIHTANLSARGKMVQAVTKIRQLKNDQIHR